MTPSNRLLEPDNMAQVFPNETRSVSVARQAVREQLIGLGLEDLITAAELVVTELVTNAVLHSVGPVELELRVLDPGIRISVGDHNPALPVVPNESVEAMTGRGLLLVRRLANRLGFEGRPGGGKVVWAELRVAPIPGDSGVDELIEAWPDELTSHKLRSHKARSNKSRSRGGAAGIADHTDHIELGDVPTELLLESEAHVDNLVREFVLAASGSGDGAGDEPMVSVPKDLAALITAVVTRFSEPRLAIKRQALGAARRGLTHVKLSIDVAGGDLGHGVADAAEAYLKIMHEADAYCREARLLTLETPRVQRVFRDWYVGEIVDHIRQAEAGQTPRPPEQFDERLLREVETVAGEWAERVRRAVADSVLGASATALGASDARIVGSEEESVPAAPVWSARACTVPLRVEGRALGAIRFAFSAPRHFDEDERRFILALAELAAQALDRAEMCSLEGQGVAGLRA